MPRPVTVMFLTLMASQLFADDTKLGRTELAKKGKPSTALILVELTGAATSGSGFVVHPDGLIVTCDHVVGRGAAKGIRVVLNAGQADQKVLKASVVRTDATNDLALLRVEPAGQFPALEVGDSDTLSELTELIGFGFPFGTRLAAAKDELPAVTVSVSSVTSLRRKDKTLATIQLDGALNPGHSGGPVLAADGKVMGVVSRGIEGAQTAMAVPANVLKSFLAAPDLTLTLPNPNPAKLDHLATFVANAKFVIPAKEKPKLELVLDLGDGTPRTIPMMPKGESYQADAALVPPRSGEFVTISAKYGKVFLSGPIADHEFQLDGRKVRLSGVKRVADGIITLADGTPGGVASGLESVPFVIAGREIPLDLTKADGFQITPPANPASLTCTVIARIDGKEVGRLRQTLALGADVVKSPAPPGAGAAFEGVKVTRKLPEAFSDVCLGGNGRYLLFLLPKLSKIALFDVTEAKVVHYFPAADPGTKFAAGANKLVIVQPGNGVIQRWDLTTRERELSLPLDEKTPIRTVVMGHASAGPVAMNATLYDPTTLKPITLKREGYGAGRAMGDGDVKVRVSADGTVFGVWGSGSPTGLQTYVYGKGILTAYYEHKTVGAVMPGPDGRFVYTSFGVYTRELKTITADEKTNAWAIHLPAAHGNLYFAVRPTDPANSYHETESMKIDVYTAGDNRLLTTIGTLKGKYECSRWGYDALGASVRFWLIPDAKVFVSLPATNDTVELTRFDLDEALAKAGVDYLFVASEPPTTAKKGAAYSHQLVVKSKKGGVKVKLDSGPTGMTVSPTGRIDWPSPDGKTATAIISVSDASGQEVFKTITLTVE